MGRTGGHSSAPLGGLSGGNRVKQGWEAMELTKEDLVAWIRQIAALMGEQRDFLTELDAAIGDADHGANMDRGFQAVLTKLQADNPSDIGGVLRTTAMTLLKTVGGAAGPLYGTFFLALATQLQNTDRIDGQRWGIALESAVKAVMARGQAQPGDKTMVDALLPALEAYKEELQRGGSFAQSLQQAAEAAEQGMRSTVPLVARRGRASYLGERSAGHQDPGATSSALILRAAAEVWAEKSG